MRLAGIYFRGTKRKLLKFFGLRSNDPYMKYKEINFFKELLSNVRPKKCLEYGCGTSTLYYMNYLPADSHWTSIEHHKAWFNKISKEISRPNLSLHFVDIERQSSEEPNEDVYASFPLPFGKFDFILVDGIRRENCIEMAPLLLEKGGILVVHDSNRHQYHEHIKKFRYWFILEDFRKSAGGLGVASNDVDVAMAVNLSSHVSLWKMDTAISNFFKFKFLLGKKPKPFRLQVSKNSDYNRG